MWWSRLPSQCVICQQWPSQRICQDCLAMPPQLERCPLCALPHGNGESCPFPLAEQDLPWSACHASLAYQAPLAPLIHRLKFNGEMRLIHALVDWMISRPPAWLDVVQTAAIVPIPATPNSLQARGFNPSAELARGLKAGLKLKGPVWHALKRLDTSRRQSRLNRDQRWSNMSQAFVPQAVDARIKRLTRPQACLLIDDVMTTGATLLHAAQSLKQLGHGPIHVWVLARTPSPPNEAP